MKRAHIAMGVAAALGLAALLVWSKGCGASREAEQSGAAGRAGAESSGRLQARARSLDVRLLARGSIEGTVRDPAGAPIAAARVCGFAGSAELSPIRPSANAAIARTSGSVSDSEPTSG